MSDIRSKERPLPGGRDVGEARSPDRKDDGCDSDRRWTPANGLLVLIPSALFLASKAREGELDATFYSVKALELVAGAVNLTLLGRNMRDGFMMTGRLKRRAKTTG